MDTSQTRRLRTRIWSWLEALLDDVLNRNAVVIENTADIAHEMLLSEEWQPDTRMLERDSAELRMVEAALARMDDGPYDFVADAVARSVKVVCASSRMLHPTSIAMGRCIMDRVSSAPIRPSPRASAAQ
jgi:hypothetical protein